MRRIKKPKPKELSLDDYWPPKWFLSFSDMVTLLMTFFLLLATMVILKIPMDAIDIGKGKITVKDKVPLTKAEIAKLKDIMKLDVKTVEVIKKVSKLPDAQIKSLIKTDETVKLYDKLSEFIKNKNLNGQIQVEKIGGNINLNIASAILFKKGRYDLSGSAKEIADLLAEFIKAYPSKIIIEGHTDNQPINTPEIPSNWELSVARANSFMRYLVENHALSPNIIEAVGYGEYASIVPNDSEENKALNRRLVIKVLPL
ncbi:MAG: flagellar motor protein MotB [Candidatus Omnitrophota bacterium]